MSGNDTGSGNGAGSGNGGASRGGDDGDDSRTARLFRREGLVSEVDLRVDTVKKMSRTILGDEKVTLDDLTQSVRGDFVLTRGSRDWHVVGTFDRTTVGAEMNLLDAALIEDVGGGVEINAATETQDIVGGAYAGTIVGPYLRISAWADFLAWGGWAEIDLVRCEIAALAIRSNMFYAHMAGARITAASRLVDDFTARIENFGVISDSQVSMMNIGGPGGGVTMET